MRISVVIPTINEAARIERAIQSAREAGADQIVVVDGGSTDETLFKAQRISDFVVKATAGRANQQNVGARLSSGDVLLFLHADNWLHRDCISQIREAVDNGARYGAFQQAIDATGWLYRSLEWANAWRAQWLQAVYGDQGIFLTRELFESVGGFPAEPVLEDLLLSRKVKSECRAALLPGPLHISARRWQQRGVIRQTLLNWAILTGNRLGVSRGRLSRFYLRHDVS